MMVDKRVVDKFNKDLLEEYKNILYSDKTVIVNDDNLYTHIDKLICPEIKQSYSFGISLFNMDNSFWKTKDCNDHTDEVFVILMELKGDKSGFIMVADKFSGYKVSHSVYARYFKYDGFKGRSYYEIAIQGYKCMMDDIKHSRTKTQTISLKFGNENNMHVVSGPFKSTNGTQMVRSMGYDIKGAYNTVAPT